MLFQRKRFFIKERVAVLKLTDSYEILDPETRQQIGIAKEEPPMWAKLARLLVKKHLLPTLVNIYEHESSPPIVTLKKKPGFLRQTVVVHHSQQGEIGRFRSKLFSFGGAFEIFDRTGKKVGELKGDWKGWNFRMVDERGMEMGVVTKKWAGIGKELFTSADNYIVALNEQTAPGPEKAPLMLAAGLAIDIVYKEAA